MSPDVFVTYVPGRSNPRMHRTVESGASLAFSCRWCATLRL